MREPRLLRLKIYRRLAFTFCMLAFLTVVGITTILYARFAAASTQEVTRLSHAMLRRTAYAASTVYDQVRYVSDQLYTTPEIMSILFARTIDRYAEYKASLKTRILQNAYPFIDYIGIYNGAIDRYWNTRLISAENEAALLSRIRRSGGGAYADCFPHVVEDTGSDTRRFSRIISFILYPNYRFTPDATMAIVINVSEASLSAILQGMSADPLEKLLIMDTGGQVIAAKEIGLFLSDQTREEYYSRLMRLEGDHGSFQALIAGRRSLVTFLTEPALGWRFVSIRPLASLLPQLDSLRRTAVIVAFLILVLGMALSLLAARFVYGPLDVLVTRYLAVPPAPKKTVDEVSLLESALSQTKRLCLKYLLLGTMPEEPFMATLLSSYERELASTRQYVCVLRIDGYGQYCREHAREERDAHHAALSDSLMDIFRGSFTRHILAMEENETVILLGAGPAGRAGEPAAIIAGLEALQKVMADYCRLSLSAGIGHAAEGAGGIRASYNAARDAASQRFFRGKGSIIDAASMEPRAAEPYPKETETRLLEALGVGRPAEAVRLLGELRGCLSRVTRERAIAYAGTLTLSIERQFAPFIGGSVGGAAPDMGAMETLNEIVSALQRYIGAVSDGMRSRDARRGEDLVAHIKRHVDGHFQEPALNLDAAANAVGRSPAHVGRLFKKETGVSFSAYLNGVRVQKAREILSTTDLPVGAVAERIGLSNATYLYTLFRKAFAETPTHYRDRLRAAAGGASKDADGPAGA